MKESVTKFNLEAAFKALDEIEIPVVKGIRPNKVNLQEKFTKKLASEVLVEDYYSVNDATELEAAKEVREAEIAKAKLARIEKIVDLNAESEEDLLPSYVGKMIIQCPQCMTLFYKNEEDVVKSEEDPEIVNVSEVCQHCGNESGYTLVGKVDQVGEEEAEEYDLDAFEDENELNLDFPEGTEEVDPEGTGEATIDDEDAKTEEDSDTELDLEPVEDMDIEEESEDETEEEEEEVKESLTLNEDVEDDSEIDEENDTPVEDEIEEEEAEETSEEVVEEESVEEEILLNVEGVKDIAAEAGEEVAEVVKENPEVEAEEIKEITDEVVETAISELESTDEEDVIEDEVSEEEVIEEEEPVEEEKVEESLTEAVDKDILSFIDKVEDPETVEILKRIARYLDKCNLDPTVENQKKAVEVCCSEADRNRLHNVVLKDGTVVKFAGLDEALTETKKNKQRLTVIEPGYQYKDKDGSVYTLYGDECEEDHTELSYEWEFVDDEDGDIYIILPEYLNEAVDKDLDAKLKAHNEYIEYLNKMIEQNEEALSRTTNEFVKEAIQRIIDKYKADLEAALPEAIKTEVAADELPTPEEAKMEDAAENKEEKEKEETKESLKESRELDHITYMREKAAKKGWFEVPAEWFENEEFNSHMTSILVKAIMSDPDQNIYFFEPHWKEAVIEIAKRSKIEVKESLTEDVIVNINVESEKEEAPVVISAEPEIVEPAVEPACLPEAECPVEPIVEPEPEIAEESTEEVVEEPVTEENPIEAEDEEIIEEACEPLTEEDNFDLSDAEAEELFNSAEFKKPISEEEVEGYLDESKSFESIFEEIDDVDDESIQKCICESLTEVYSNVENFIMESCEMDNGSFKINGTINFKSGNTTATSYVFTEAKRIDNNKIALKGINETLSKDSNFVLEANINSANRSMAADTLSYSYSIDNNLVEGLIKHSK